MHICVAVVALPRDVLVVPKGNFANIDTRLKIRFAAVVTPLSFCWVCRHIIPLGPRNSRKKAVGNRCIVVGSAASVSPMLLYPVEAKHDEDWA